MKFCKIFFLLVLPYASFAFQDIPVRELSQRLSEYYEKQAPLKVHLFLNQTRYRPGDTILFKASVIYAATLKEVEKSTILNVLLLDGDNQVSAAEKVRLKEGEAHNQLIIPSTLQPGRYRLVAYHDWSKESSPELYYQRHIDIAGEKEFIEKYDTLPLSFYPEGGSLIAGVNNKVVVRSVSNRDGKVRNAQGIEVATFTTDANGIGTFYLKPESNQTYIGEITNSSSTEELPKATIGGISIIASPYEEGDLKLIIQRSALSDIRKVKIVADNHNGIYHSAWIKLDQEAVTIAVPLMDARAGISRITIFNENGDRMAERLFFVPTIPKISANLTINKKELGTREKASVLLSVKDAGGRPVEAKFSVTAFQRHGAIAHRSNIENIFLSSDLSGTLTNPSFSLTSDEDLKKVDLHLISQQWKRAAWTEVMDQQNPLTKHTNIRFVGETVNEKTGQAFSDSTFITFFLQKNVMTYQTFTNKGKFDIPLFIDFFGEDEVYYRIEKRGKRLDDVKIVIYEYPEFNYPHTSITASQQKDLFYQQAQQHQIVNNSFGFFRHGNEYQKVREANAHIEEEVFGPDATIDLDKYVLFPTMEETIREIIPMVQHRRVKDQNVVRIYFADIDRLANESPLYIIDGVVTDDTDYFVSLKPSDVAKIKVIHSREKLSVFGAIGKGGVILVDTKVPDLHTRIPRSKHSFKVQGLSEPVIRKPFNPSVWRSRIPDLRTNLIWSADMSTDEKGEAEISFYTSDVTGEFQIQIEGVTSRGELFYKEETIKVEFKPVSN